MSLTARFYPFPRRLEGWARRICQDPLFVTVLSMARKSSTDSNNQATCMEKTSNYKDLNSAAFACDVLTPRSFGRPRVLDSSFIHQVDGGFY
jgi:hypothetical protein